MPLRALCLLALAGAHRAAGHGYLLTPVPRQNGGDMTTHQDDPTAGPCKSLPPAAAPTTTLSAGANYTLSWTITIAHGGYCYLRWAVDQSGLSYDGSTGTMLWSSTTCGDETGDAFYSSFIAPTTPLAKGVLQWFWNGGGQIYQDCVDFAVAAAPSVRPPPGATAGGGVGGDAAAAAADAAAADAAARLVSIAAIAGGVIGALLLAAVVAVGAWHFRRGRGGARKSVLVGSFGTGETRMGTAHLPLPE
jgi:hypothetical protein